MNQTANLSVLHPQRAISPLLKAKVLAVIADIIDVSKGKWISVKTNSISKFLQKRGVQTIYTSIIVKKLEDLKILTFKETPTGIEYRVIKEVLPDLSDMAVECIKEARIKQAAYADTSHKKRNPDLTQKVTPDQKDINHNGKATIQVKPTEVARKPLQIGDVKYMMQSNKVTEVRICSITEWEDSTLVCIVTHYNPSEKAEILTDELVPAGSLYPNAEMLVATLLKNVSKNIKRQPKEICNYE